MGEGWGAGRTGSGDSPQPQQPGRACSCVTSQGWNAQAMLLSEQSTGTAAHIPTAPSSNSACGGETGLRCRRRLVPLKAALPAGRGKTGGTVVPLAPTTLWGNCPCPQAFSCTRSEQDAPSVHAANVHLPAPWGSKKRGGSSSWAAGKCLDAVSCHHREPTPCQTKTMQSHFEKQTWGMVLLWAFLVCRHQRGTHTPQGRV